MLMHYAYVAFGAASFMTVAAEATGLRRELAATTEIVDLSKPFEESPLNNKSECAKKMIELAEQEPEVRGLMVLEHGKVVAEYYATGVNSATRAPVWSCTKTFTALLLGILIRDGYLSLDETLGDIWNYDPYNAIWGSAWDADNRKALTIRSILTMTAGLSLPE